MLTQKLAEFVAGTGSAPSGVMKSATNALIDTVGVALVGTLEPVSEIARRWAADLGARPQASVWGSAMATSPAEAAFVNGIAGHVLDYDDTSPSLRGHPSTTLIPTVLAVGEAVRARGKATLTAYAVGLEVAGKLAKALGNAHYLRGWHNTVTVGVFSCTAAAGRLLGLDVPQLRNALGLAASQSAGLLRNFGTMTKAFHAGHGHAARCGIHSAWLARHGFTADPSILDGKDGFFATYGGSDGEPFAELVRKLADPWEVVKPGINFKRWPCCYQIHRGVVGLMDLLAQHGIKTGEIESIAVGFPPGSDAALIYDDPRNGLEGKFSAQYTAAAYVLDRRLGLDSYTDDMVARPAVRELMSKIRRYRVPDTKTYTRAAWVVTDAEHDEKFLECAVRVLGEDQATRILGLARRCENLEDVSVLARATTKSTAAAASRAASRAKRSRVTSRKGDRRRMVESRPRAHRKVQASR
ncbi:MAG: MmgE/PrpD family protein [Betaproteobacteria bacterium]|nr:MmgE/PrpD family protein [Betaproteobacteria bacterium]